LLVLIDNTIVAGLFMTDQLRRILLEAIVPYMTGHLKHWSQPNLPKEQRSTVEKQSNFEVYELECHLDDYGELVVQVRRKMIRSR
jgi:hypothetical protein